MDRNAEPYIGIVEEHLQVDPSITVKPFFEIQSRIIMKKRNPGHQTILVIDDEEAVREAVFDILGFEGWRVLTAVDGPAGIELFKICYREVDLVLLDLSMPGMSGAETFQKLKEIEPEVKVILSSGFDEAEVTRHFVGAGLAGFLQKPYDMQHLVKKVKEYSA